MRLAALQTDIEWESPRTNFARLSPLIAQMAGEGAELVVLPEMFACGFSMKTATVAEEFNGPTSEFLLRTAQEHRIWICGSIPERSPRSGDPRPSNTLVLAAPNGEARRYRKLHPFTFGGEHQHYAPGDEQLTVEISGVRCTFYICYDLRFANEFWSTARLTDLFIVPANWPAPRREHWLTLLSARAIENQAYVCGVNRVGEGGGLTYAGDSRIIAPDGAVVAGAGADTAMLWADVSAATVAAYRASFPTFQDRRRVVDGG
ncbi:MAG: carbon-nitrogen family hydrolase [Acidobacteriota bacterium]